MTRADKLRERYHSDPEFRERVLARQRKANLKPARKQYSKEWQRQPKNKVNSADIHYRRKYGITAAEKEQMLVGQGGKCAACGSCEPQSKLGWRVDHDHDTKKVRAILCGLCNLALGALKEDVVKMQALIEYIGRHKCQI